MDIATRQKIALILVFFDHIKQVLKALLTMEYFPLSVYHVFLQVVSRRFRKAEVLHSVRHIYAHFFTHSEKMINCISAGQYYSSVFKNVHSLLSKFLSRNTFNMNKRPKIYLKFVLCSKVKIRRFFCRWFRL